MRKAEYKRKTKETDISLIINIDGIGNSNVSTGIPFLDHMINSFSKHSCIDIDLKVKGDIEVDFHHTIEDTGISLGYAIKEALGDKKGITRFADATLPLDDALSRVSMDISGRAYLQFNVNFPQSDDGNNINPYLFEEFFRGFVNSSQITLHIDLIRGNNSHHILESIFKSFAKAMKTAVKIEGTDIPSTKGII